ncbi:hypothetical protein AWC38_SpisGene4800 [Stylophora pistillata]|uniref:GIY-YIG domain-containing protein n=1 Tax=Stylophora pistillata TaxID=50429 RepID=A0A2B4SMW0_STYPI|nr:hypothetical protein AWC38_SpisGene4800 [Stylophora pistillata]
MDLLNICLTSTYFQYNGKHYKQLHGTAMGSPVSVVIAEIVMQNIEERALSTCRQTIPLWLRYVDDTFTAVRHDEIDAFHNHLNEQNTDIQFTREVEENGKLPFLDCLVSHNDNSLRTTVYRKPTHTDRLLDESSYNPTSHKATTIRTLTRRAQLVCDSTDSLSDENKYLHRVFTKNNYNNDFIRRNTHRPTTTTETNDTATPTTTATIPYIKGMSENISRILLPFNIRVAHKPITTLRQLLTNVKDKDEPRNRQGTIYKINCSDCQASYIGETGRNLTTRLTEHRRATRKGDVSNHIAEHHRLTNHNIDWDSAQCLTYSTDYFQRLTLESWFTNLEQTPLNRCQQLPAPYKRLIHDINIQTTEKERLPFVIYADFEAITEKIHGCQPSDKKSFIEAYQKHTDCGYGYKVVCCYDDKYTKPIQTYRGEKAVYRFMENMLEDVKYCRSVIKSKFNKPLKMTKGDEEQFKNAVKCHIWEKEYTEKDIRVRDHCNVTGSYRGSTHQACNLNFQITDKIPVIFHNLRGYDSHFVMQEIGEIVKNNKYTNKKEEECQMNINTIPNNLEKYMAFMLGDHPTFIDSFQFISSSLDKLVNNLPKEAFKYSSEKFKNNELDLMTKKAVYSYNHMDSFEKFNETKLPTRDEFYSILNDEHISDDEYKHAETVW